MFECCNAKGKQCDVEAYMFVAYFIRGTVHKAAAGGQWTDVRKTLCLHCPLLAAEA